MATKQKQKRVAEMSEDAVHAPHILKKGPVKPVTEPPPLLPPQRAEDRPTTREERKAQGKALRDQCPRADHAAWEPATDRRDPVELIEESNKGRVPNLIPLRYGRMLQSPFAFLRGSASVMAYDLAATPVSGIRVQACGDCHLMNFGTFASPERTLIFDINDFDETLPAPWEWDVKRLAASFVVASRHLGLPERDAVAACVGTYREKMRELADLTALEVWYARVDVDSFITLAQTDADRRRHEKIAAKARRKTSNHLVEELTTEVDGKRKFKETPPFVFHPPHRDNFEEEIRAFQEIYRVTLQEDRQQIFDRYRLVDVTMKVGGVGSVGTRCAIALFEAEPGDALILQYKQARASVLETHAGLSQHGNAGQRVVYGQRMMQSASDIFLGWSHENETDSDFYFRQLRDMNTSITIEDQSVSSLREYAEHCGWGLARAHAKGSGEAARISGYLGKKDEFDHAIVEFAVAYADQTERDYEVLVEAFREGKIAANVGEPER